MTVPYKYELWNGKKVVGYHFSTTKILGRFLVFPYLSPLKQSYFRKIKTITVPVSMRMVSDDGIDHLYRTVLDVRHKSKRQIEHMINNGS